MIKLIISITIALTIKEWLIDPLIMSFFWTKEDINNHDKEMNKRKSFQERIDEKIKESKK